jgi:hypothetical protein
MTLSLCLRGMTKNMSFLHFWAVSWPIVHSFGFWGDFQGPWPLVHVWQAWPKTHCFCVYGHFCELLPTVWGFWGDLHGPWHSVHVWEAWPKTCRVYIFSPFLWAIVHSFGVFGVILKAHDTWFLFDRHDQKLIVFVYMAIFVSYFPLFWGSGGFTWPMALITCLRGMTKNSPFLCFRVIFMSYCPLFWVSKVIYKAHDTH